MVYEDYLRCSEYENKEAHASESGFAAFYHEESQRYFFALLDGVGGVLLKSEGYPQQAARENGIQSVIKNRSNADFYSVKTYENGRHYISLRAANYREIARSCSFETEGEAVAMLPYITGEKIRTLEATAATAEVEKERANNKVDDDYMICREYAGQGTADADGIVKFTHANGKHYFAWVDADGDVIMRSEGYPTTAARDNGAASVVKNRENEDRYSVLERMGRYFVILKAGNHQEIARSCPYESETRAKAIYPSHRATIVTEVEPTIIKGITETVVGTGTVETETTTGTTETTVSEFITTTEATETTVVETVAPTVTNITTVTETVTKVVVDIEDDYLPCREYQGHSVNDIINNIATFQHENGQYYFVVYNANGSVRLRSEGFDSDETRASELAAVIKYLENEDMYETITRGDYYIKVLKDETGREIGRSCLQKDEIEVIPPVVEVAPVVAAAAIAATVEEPKVEAEPDVEDDYLACKEYEGHHVNDKVNNVALFKHANGQFYFAMYDENGKVRLRSEGFQTAQDRDKELSGALKGINNPEMYSTIRRGNYYMQVLKNAQGKEVGRSCLEKDEPVVPVIPVIAAAAAVAAPTVEADVEDDYLPCKDYEGRTINDKVNNVAMFKHDNGQYYFAIYNADGKVRLRSEGFRTAQDRDKELSGALKNLNNADMYSTIRRGNYWMTILKDAKGREVGRSCLEKEEPKAIPVVPVAAAAVAAAAAIIETPKVTVDIPKVEIPKVTYEAPVVNEVVEEVATGGFKWWWLLPLLLAAAAWWFMKDGCNKPEVKAPEVTAVPIDTPKVTVAPTPAPPVGCPACQSSSDPIFTAVCDNPKKLSRLGTNPEFGNSHSLSPSEFYEKLKKAHANNAVDKEFLDRIYKGMGYTGFADAKPEQFSAVTLPVGSTGRLGYSKAHKTGCYTLPDDEYHRKAFRIEAANGCTFHFMKTCGNHFFFCAN